MSDFLSARFEKNSGLAKVSIGVWPRLPLDAAAGALFESIDHSKKGKCNSINNFYDIFSILEPRNRTEPAPEREACSVTRCVLTCVSRFRW